MQSRDRKAPGWIKGDTICPGISLFILLVFAWTVLWGKGEPTRDTLSFFAGQADSTLDLHSFYPNLVLRFDWGPFYRFPKNPLLTPTPGSWDSKDVADPFVLVLPEGLYLFYDGDDGHAYTLGYAERDREGWGWVKRAALNLPAAAPWEARHRIAPVLCYSPSGWKLYYSGHREDLELGYQIGVFAGQPPDQWVLVQEEPVLTARTDGWDFAGVNYADVLFDFRKGLYRMWYTGFQGLLAAIGYAESRDGVRWHRPLSRPVFQYPPGVIAPDVLYDGRRFTLFFVQAYLAGKRGKTRIMRTVSEDGLHWGPPTTVLEPADKWEGGRLMRPHLAFFEGKIQLYYAAQKGGRWQIGAAWCQATFAREGSWRSPWQPAPRGPESVLITITGELPRGSWFRARYRWEGEPQFRNLNEMEARKTLRWQTYQFRYRLPTGLSQGRRWQLELLLGGDGYTSPQLFPVAVERRERPGQETGRQMHPKP